MLDAMAKKRPPSPNSKNDALEPFRERAAGELMTTDQGVGINDDQNSLKAGERGATLLEDFILREPRSYRMMEGFGIHTFRFINAKGKSRFVKFHWKPVLGMHSVAWNEALTISGFDSDCHRRDLWESIEAGAFPEYEFGIQVVEEKDEHKFDFDLLDPTKIIPEEIVPVRRIGKMTLNRNPDNFHAETEQVAFHPGHVVPGIDFTNDPLLQGRLFSYTDTQLLRLGGPNFHEIPINRSINPIHNHQRDGHMRQEINVGRVAYEPNSLGGGGPMQMSAAAGGFVSFNERIDAQKVRARSESSSITSARRRCSISARRPTSRRTSSTRCASSWGRWRPSLFASGWYSSCRKSTRRSRGGWRTASGCQCR